MRADRPAGTSARNQLPARVLQILPGAVNDTLTLALSGGDHLTAIISSESTRLLKLAPDSEVMALIKAPWIIVATGANPATVSARNQLAGSVAFVTPGAVNTEISIRLAGGTLLTAILNRQSASSLGLAVGQRVTAIIKATDVILAARTP